VKKVAVIVVVLLLLLVVAIGAGTYWLGMQTQDAYSSLLQNIAKNGQATISNLRYEHGWLSSTAEATISVPGIPGGLSLTSHIQHGPFPGVMDLQFMPGMAVVDSVLVGNSAASAKFPPVRARTMIFLAGNSETQLDIPAYKRPGVGYGWVAASGGISVSADQQTIKGHVNFPQMQLSGAAGSITLTQTAIDWDQEPGVTGLGFGGYNLSVGRAIVQSSKGNASIEGLRAAASSRESAGNMTANLSLQVHAVDDGESSFGPGQIALQLRKVDTASLTKYQREMQALGNKKLPPGQMGPAMLGKTSELVMALARKTPELEITKLAFKVGGSEITGKGKFVLDASGLAAGDTPVTLQQAVNGAAELFVPRSAVATLAEHDILHQLSAYKTQGTLTPDEIKKLTPEKISAITDAALPTYMDKVVSRMHLVPNGGDYKLTIAARQGQLLINEQPVGQPAGGSAATQKNRAPKRPQ